ncbi:hypothetical protein N2152v2_008753 [Parachlorella kessleri]
MTLSALKPLPVDKERKKICDKVFLNRVTLVLGSTGCGKSSRVPQMLLEELGGPILCTQPRRLAVVAVAKRVAEERGVTLGGDEVGYRIGQRPHYTSKTSIVFATAGVLLEDMRGQGLKALAAFKCIVMDEVHERSVESDLVLTCLREFMASHRALKLVLMSATADIDSYERYFKGILDGRLDRVDIPDYGLTLRHLLLTTRVMYLEEAVKLVAQQGRGSHQDLLDLYRTSPEQVEGRVGSAEQGLLRDLVAALHATDFDLSHAVLAFLPTYKTLETLHELLLATGLPLAIYALHSSIDVDDCLASMEAAPAGQRKVILATNIAESSVTIPHVHYVLDACRTLQISWDRDGQASQARIVWASKSQADQRKGRTGRTCDGVVYRLVPRRVFDTSLPRFEAPAVTLQPLRRETLGLLCSDSALTNHPQKLLARCMDPPDPQVVQDALEHLEDIGAAEPKAKAGQYQATPYGRFLGHMPVSLEAAQLVAQGGKAGLLQPAAVLAAILNITPFPIHRPFASFEQYRQHLRRYYAPAAAPSLDPTAVLLANLGAYTFWQHGFHDPRRLHLLQQLGGRAGQAVEGALSGISNSSSSWEGLAGRQRSSSDESSSSSEGSSGEGQPGAEEERAWCARHALIHSSLQAAAELVILGVAHKFGPDFLQHSLGPPRYFDACLPRHQCKPPGPAAAAGRQALAGPAAAAAAAAAGTAAAAGGLQRRPGEDEKKEEAGSKLGSAALCVASWMGLERLYEPQDVSTLQQLLLLKDLSPSDIEAASMSRSSSLSSNGGSLLSAAGSVLGDWPQQGQKQRQRPLCRFFSKGGCDRGASCRFSHEAQEPALDSSIAELALRPLGFGWPTGQLAEQRAQRSDSSGGANQGRLHLLDFGPGDSVLVLGDGDLAFSEALACKSLARVMASVKLSLNKLLETYPGVEARLEALSNAGTPVLAQLDATQLHSYHTPSSKAMLCPTPPARLRHTPSSSSSYGSSYGSGLSYGRPCDLWPLEHSTHLVWQFPFTGRDEDVEVHKRLMAAFLASAAAAMLRLGFRAQVLVTLCNDQYQRWAVEAAARESFFYIAAIEPFDAAQFPGYQPKRGHLDEPFPHEKALTYAFELQTPHMQL